MNGIYLLNNSVQEYAWGSKTAIAELLGNPEPSPVPQAELWMGAHPKAPSLVVTPEVDIPLNGFIDADPENVLGAATARRFENRLPYLFKVLAAAKPLSIQAHPDLAQARQGFERENRIGIDIKAPERNYRDANHKPECICALTDYWAMNGFRESEDIARRMQTLCPVTLNDIIDRTLPEGTVDLRRFFEALMTMETSARRQVVSEALENLPILSENDDTGTWIQRLQDEYPYDIGVLSPSILNLVCLKPGQAMFLPAGQLHAYLEGVGIELMANSDNVLRGGLTPKHVDVTELMRVLNFKATRLEILLPEPVSTTEKVYRTAADEFELSVIDTENSRPHANNRRDAVQILLCTAGRATLSRPADSGKIEVRKGTCLLVKADAPAFQIEGEATFYRAAVPKKSFSQVD
jgi:mannose-6-phosphate isomerase